MLAPKTYAGQMKAHYNVDVSACDNSSPRFVGSYHADIGIGEVTATAAGDNGRLS